MTLRRAWRGLSRHAVLAVPLCLLVALLCLSVDWASAQPGGSAGGGGVRLQDEGGLLGTVGTLNCVGSGITCTKVGGLGTLTIPSGVTGSGTASFLPLWATATSLGTSLLYQDTPGGAIYLPVFTTGPDMAASPLEPFLSILTVEVSSGIAGLGALPFFQLLRANGSWAIPTKILAGGQIGAVGGAAWDGVTVQYTPYLDFRAVTDADSGSLSLLAMVTRQQALDVIALGGLQSVAPELTITTGLLTLDAILTATNKAAPASPAAGFVSLYTDSTDLRLHDKNAAGVIGTTVVADTGAANNFLTAISVAGAISKAQPSFSNISSTLLTTQMVALTGDVTNTTGLVATTIANDAVTYAKMQNVSAASRLLGRGSAGGAGDPEEITLGSGLTMTGTALSATAGGGTVTGTGTTGVLTKWTNGAGGVLGDSLLSESGAVVTLAGSLTQTQSLGTELVTNGDFTTGTCDGWTTTGWTCNAGTDVQHDTGNTTALTPTTPITITAGTTYRLVFTVSSRTAGTVTASVGGITDADRSTNATFTVYLVAISTGNLAFTPTSTFDGHIDDVSVREVTETIAASTGPLVLGSQVAIVDAIAGYRIAGSPILQWPSSQMTVVGVGAGIVGTANTFVGASAGASATGTSSIFIGVFAGQNVTATEVIAIGNSAGGIGAVGARSILIGANAGRRLPTTATDNILIGRNIANDVTVDATLQNVVIGQSAFPHPTTARDNVAVGYGAASVATTESFGVAIGSGAELAQSGIAIGYKAKTALNEFRVGSDDTNGGITTMYIGQGILKASPSAVTWSTTGGSGADNIGADLTLAPGRSTGNAAAGSLFFATSTPGASGSTLRALANRWKISGATPASGNPGDLIAVTDGAVNIGVTGGANRPDKVFLKTSLEVGGNVVAGTIAGKLAAVHLAIASQAIGDLLYADAATTFTRLADVAAGGYLRSGGVAAAPLWSTLTLPNAATTGDTFIATGTNAMGVVAAGATGAYFRGAGAGTAPIWSTVTLPNALTTGDTLIATGTNAVGVVAAGATGAYFRGAGAGTASIWSTLTLPNAATTGDILAATGTNAVGVIAATTAGLVLTANGAGVASTYQDSAASAQTLTNKTLDAEGTGNVITIPEEHWYEAAGCNNATASLILNSNTTNAPAAVCEGTNTRLATADFDDTTDEGMDFSFRLKTGWTGAIDVIFRWKAAATTGAVGWCAQLAKVSTGATSDPSLPAQAAGNCVSSTVAGTTLQETEATISAVTCTSCAAGDRVNVRISRDANGGAVTDSMTGDAKLLGFMIRTRRAM